LNRLHTIAFLVPLGRWAGDRLLVLWDGSPIHRRAEVGAFVTEARGKIRGERRPSYAPDLNPVEGLWRHLKEVEWRNVSCLDLDQLHLEFDLALGRVRQKQRLMPTFFEGAELAV
jgi:transposase